MVSQISHSLQLYTAIIRSRLTEVLFTDASLIGGAILQGHAFFAINRPTPLFEWNLAIFELEIFTILVAIMHWLPYLTGTTVQVWSDNEATVLTIRSGKTRNLLMADCIRELWFLCASADVDVIISHIAGKDNHVVDLLSCRFCSTGNNLEFRNSNVTVSSPLLLILTSGIRVRKL